MAVTSTAISDRLTIKVVDGTTSDGKPKIKNKSYSNISVTATDGDVYAAANAIAGLQTKALNSIAREKTTGLVEA
jgi:hypothetical protein